jgi:hypothetical protein
MQNEKISSPDMIEKEPTPGVMSEVSFEEDKEGVYTEPSPDMAKILMNCSFGLIKRERSAKIILVIFAVILFSATIAIWMNTGNENKNNISENARRAIMEKMRSK